MIYFFIFILLLFLSFRYDICGKIKGRNFCYGVVLVIFILVAGLRWRLGTDTIGTLEKFYYLTPLLDSYFKLESFDVRYPLWNFLQSFVYTLFGRFYVVQLIQAAFVNVLFFLYFKKHSKFIFTCTFFYFIWMYTTFNMEEMKSSMSVGLMLYANDYILAKKKLKAFLLFVLGCMFHFSTMFLIITPLLLFLRCNKTGIIFIISMCFLGFYLQITLGDYFTLFEISEDISDKFEHYSESEHYSTGREMIRFVLFDLPVILYSLFSIRYIKRFDKCNELLKLEPFLIIGLCFLMLSGNIFIFYRYYHFYVVYVILFVVEFFRIASNRKLMPSVAFLLLFPLIISMTLPYKENYFRYYPYCSVMDRELNKLREQRQYYNHPNRLAPDFHQY